MRYDDIGRGFLYVPMCGYATSTPPGHSGQRVTWCLSNRAARQIKGASFKAHAIGAPLRTFVTFTVRAEERPAFLSGELVLGQEMKRTLNALNEGFRRAGRGTLVYVWVAEDPGDDNPHVHLLTNHRVPRKEFAAFASHLEELWGHGFAHIESIKQPKSAGRYILKAVGYTAKGTDAGQGLVIGNRYGIARSIMPRYSRYDVYDAPGAAEGLRNLQITMTADVEPLGKLTLTRYGLSFPAGTALDQIAATARELGEAVHTNDDGAAVHTRQNTASPQG